MTTSLRMSTSRGQMTSTNLERGMPEAGESTGMCCGPTPYAQQLRCPEFSVLMEQDLAFELGRLPDLPGWGRTCTMILFTKTALAGKQSRKMWPVSWIGYWVKLMFDLIESSSCPECKSDRTDRDSCHLLGVPNRPSWLGWEADSSSSYHGKHGVHFSEKEIAHARTVFFLLPCVWMEGFQEGSYRWIE